MSCSAASPGDERSHHVSRPRRFVRRQSLHRSSVSGFAASAEADAPGTPTSPSASMLLLLSDHHVASACRQTTGGLRLDGIAPQRVVAVRVFEAYDIRVDRRFHGVGAAPVSSSPICHPCPKARKRQRSNRNLTAIVRNDWIGRPVKCDHRDGCRVCAPSPQQRLRGRYGPDRGDPMRHRAGKRECHASAVGHTVGIDPRRIDVVVRRKLVDQLREKSDIWHVRLRLRPFHEPGFRPGDPRRVHDDEAVFTAARSID